MLCESNADCSTPEVCVRNLYGLDVCAAVECQTDADCVADTCGFCEPGYFASHGTDVDDPSASLCRFPDLCGAASCAGCFDVGDSWHGCGP